MSIYPAGGPCSRCAPTYILAGFSGIASRQGREREGKIENGREEEGGKDMKERDCPLKRRARSASVSDWLSR